ncbi:MAG: hypothetical protein ABI885_28545 [Gammaproteobacteria bacterium]
MNVRNSALNISSEPCSMETTGLYWDDGVFIKATGILLGRLGKIKSPGKPKLTPDRERQAHRSFIVRGHRAEPATSSRNMVAGTLHCTLALRRISRLQVPGTPCRAF